MWKNIVAKELTFRELNRFIVLIETRLKTRRWRRTWRSIKPPPILIFETIVDESIGRNARGGRARERQVNAFVAFDRRAICIGSAQIVPRSINIGMSRMTSRARCALNKLIIIIIKFSREVLLFEKWQGNLVGLNREERGKGRSNGDRSSLQIINNAFLDLLSFLLQKTIFLRNGIIKEIIIWKLVC